MASGVEIRMPFLDHRIVCFSFSLPWTSKVGGGYTKRILRDAMKDLLPEETRLNRTKLGWNAPLHEWLRGPLRSEMIELRNSGELNRQEKDKVDKFDRMDAPTFAQVTEVWNTVLLPGFWRRSLRMVS
jgi:asparagine synthase (glutamine-hydrolysing)